MNRDTSQCPCKFFAFAIFFALLLFPCAISVRAQGETSVNQAATPVAPSQEGEQPPKNDAGALLTSLNLTPEQLSQMRIIRQETERVGRPLTQRVRQARRALDQAIYSDNADESLIELRARELAQAQAEATRLRALTELRVRRVLTPEQLGKLREMRRQAQIEQRQNRREGLGARPRRRTLRDAFNNRRQQGESVAPGESAQPVSPDPTLRPRPRRGGVFRRRPRL